MDKARKALELAEAMLPSHLESKKLLALQATGVRAQLAIAEQLGRLVELLEPSVVELDEVRASLSLADASWANEEE